VSQSPGTHASAMDAMVFADEALYEAKGSGRDRAVVRRL